VSNDTPPPPSEEGRPGDPQGALIDALSADAVRDLLGPSWSAMSAAEREAYGPRVEPSHQRARGRFRDRYVGLTLWRDEVRRGVHDQETARPATWLYDELWRAACWEASAADAEARDEYDVRDDGLRRAREILTTAQVAVQ
jgi:hypothetical protein